MAEASAPKPRALLSEHLIVNLVAIGLARLQI